MDEVATGRGAEGLAVAPDGATVWVSNAQDGTISIVDLGEGRLLETVPSGGRFPVKLAFTPNGRTVWVVNKQSRSLTVLDAGTRSVLCAPLPSIRRRSGCSFPRAGMWPW